MRAVSLLLLVLTLFSVSRDARADGEDDLDSLDIEDVHAPERRYDARLRADVGLGASGSTDGSLLRVEATLRTELQAFIVGATLASSMRLFGTTGWEVGGLVGGGVSLSDDVRIDILGAAGWRSREVNRGGFLTDLEQGFAYESPFVGLHVGADWYFTSLRGRWNGMLGLDAFVNVDLAAADRYTYAFDSCDFLGNDCTPMRRQGRHGGGFEGGVVLRVGFGVGMF